MFRIPLVLLVLVSAFFSSATLAGSGKATLSHYRGFFASGANYMIPGIFVTNITEENVKVKITVFNQFGDVFVDGDDDPTTGVIRGVNVSNGYNEDPGNESVEFTLLPRNTGLINLILPNLSNDENRGYAVIEWEIENSDTVVALLSHSIVSRGTPSSHAYTEYSVMINNGMPF